MLPGSNTIMILNLIALGIIGVILSFLVPDRKKSLISLGLAIAIVVVGVIQWGANTIARVQMEYRMRQMQKERQVDFDALRQKLKDQSGAAAPAAGAAKR